VRELLESISSEELSTWMAYDAIEPFGERRADLRSAQICAVLANIHRKKDSKPFSPADFLIHFDAAYDKGKDQDARVEEAKTKVSGNLNIVAKSGAVIVYEGAAPAIKRIGKRGKKRRS
jgi:hypothetical protein